MGSAPEEKHLSEGAGTSDDPSTTEGRDPLVVVLPLGA